MFNDKIPMLSSPTTPNMSGGGGPDDPLQQPVAEYIKPSKGGYTKNAYDFSNVRLSAPSGVRVNDSARNAYNYYVNDKGLPAHVAAGIVGNLYRESELKPTAIEQGNTGAGRGIAQWDKDVRWPAYLKWAKENGKSPMDLHSQLDYVLIEPGWGDKALKKTMAAKDSTEAAMIFGKSFERPNEQYARWDLRAGAAKTLFDGL